MRRIIPAVVVVFFLYCAVWMSLALPYRLFPSDDDAFASYLAMDGARPTLALIACSHHPVFVAWLQAVGRVWLWFSRDLQSVVGAQAVISNAALCAIVTAMIFFFTRSFPAALAGAAVFGFSAWPVNYIFFSSYAPFTTMFSTVCLWFLFLSRDCLPGRRDWYLAAAGACAALFFWSCPSALVMIALYCLLLLVLPDSPGLPRVRGSIRLFLKAFALVALPFAIYGSDRIWDHIFDNFIQQGVSAELARPPALSFFRIFSVYDPVFSAVFLAVSAVSAVFAFRRWNELGRRQRAIFAILLIVWAHSALVDILPSTKLARTHFPVFPLAVIATAGCAHILYGALRRVRYRLLFLSCAGVLLACSAWQGVALSSRIFHIRTDAPKYLQRYFNDRTVYLLEEDDHSGMLDDWLRYDCRIKVISKNSLETIDFSGGQAALLLGPRGAGAGKSILSNYSLGDFYADDILRQPRIAALSRKVLPYYAYFPVFQFEEESCLGAYFSLSRIDDSQDEKNLLLLYAPAVSGQGAR